MTSDAKAPGPFVIVSGLPASGKTSLARRLSPALDLLVIDKDDILQSLFESKGIGDFDWRRRLSRESDEILQRDAASSRGAILVSFWRLAGMPEGSGTPTGWVTKLSDEIVGVQCCCDPDAAARRFVQRNRHPGHLDSGTSYDEAVARFEELSRLGSIAVGQEVLVDTSEEPELDPVVRDIRTALARCPRR